MIPISAEQVVDIIAPLELFSLPPFEILIVLLWTLYYFRAI